MIDGSRGFNGASAWQGMGLIAPKAAISAPDPRSPARLYRIADASNSGSRRWLAQRERQSVILAASRRQIEEGGYDGVCLKQVAKLCGLPKQTIYNIVGSRDEMISQASAEWVEWLALSTLSKSPESALFAVLWNFWLSAAAFPEYTAQSARAACAPFSPLNQAFRRASTSIVKSLLADLAHRGAVCPSLDLSRFSWQLTELAHAGVCRWVQSPYGLGDFQRDFVFGPGMMLRAALRGPEAILVDAQLSRIINSPSSDVLNETVT
jgi:AcrR family transcriptional regulator